MTHGKRLIVHTKTHRHIDTHLHRHVDSPVLSFSQSFVTTKSTFCHICISTRAKHCNTLPHTTTQCSMLRHTAAHCSTLQHTATHCNTLQHTATHCYALQHTATHCNTLQHTATHCNTLQHTATHCRKLQHTAAHCNTLQHTATHCNTHILSRVAHSTTSCSKFSKVNSTDIFHGKSSNNLTFENFYQSLPHPCRSAQ